MSSCSWLSWSNSSGYLTDTIYLRTPFSSPLPVVT